MGIIGALKYHNREIKGFNTDQLSQLIERAYTSESQAGFKQKTSFSPSTVGYGHGTCPRYWWHAFNGAEFADTADAQGKAKMLNGTYVHDRLQKILEKTGVVKQIEREIKNSNPPIRGFMDVVIDYYGEEVIGEIKSIGTEQFLIKTAEMKPSGSHLVQILIYMKLSGAENGFVLYEDKNDQSIVAIPVKMSKQNSEYVDYVFKWMQEVYETYEAQTMPTRQFTKSQSACKYCPVKSTCWAKDAPNGEIDIPALRVPK